MKKERFITAYCYCYGATKKEAREAWRNASPEYIAAIIESQQTDARAAFNND